MTTPSFSLEPEVEALIQEIARDPRSSFLKVPRPAQPRDLAGTWERFSSVSAGWTAAERHLLDAHREEVAYWMRTKVLVEVLELPGERDRVRVRPRVRETSVPSRADLARRAESLVLDEELLPPHSLDFLSAATASTAMTIGQIHSLAVLSGRIAPTDIAWLRLGLTLHHLGHHRAQVRLIETRLQDVASRTMKVCFLMELGAAHFADENHPSAFRAYETAAHHSPGTFAPAHDLLAEALILGDVETALRCLQVIDDATDPLASEVAQVARLIRSSPVLQSHRSEIAAVARQLDRDRGPSSELLLHAYA